MNRDKQVSSATINNDVNDNKHLLNSGNNRDYLGNISTLIKHDSRTYNWTPVHQVDMIRNTSVIPSRLCSPSSNIDSRKYNLNQHDPRRNTPNHEDNKENEGPYIKESPSAKRRYQVDSNNNYCTSASSTKTNRLMSEPPKILPKPDDISAKLILGSNKNMIKTTKNGKVTLMLDIDLENCNVEILTLKERRNRSDRVMTGYLMVTTPDIRDVPGFNEPLSPGDRLKYGTDYLV